MILDAETAPFVDVTAARMLVAAHDELHTHGVRLVLARAVGQVRDVLGCITREDDLTASYPTIDAASTLSSAPVGPGHSQTAERAMTVARRATRSTFAPGADERLMLSCLSFEETRPVADADTT